MSRGRVHIVSVQIDSPFAAALESSGWAAVGQLGERVDVYITFQDGSRLSRYMYPNVPAALAAAVYLDPEGGPFQNIRYWPGYQRV